MSKRLCYYNLQKALRCSSGDVYRTYYCKKLHWKVLFSFSLMLIDVDQNMNVVQEEIFGPVVVAIPFSDLDEILLVANNTAYGLAAGIWTKDLSKAHHLAASLRAGTVWVNCYYVFDAAFPFDRYKQSGCGREMGHEVLENDTEVKSVCIGL